MNLLSALTSIVFFYQLSAVYTDAAAAANKIYQHKAIMDD